VKPIFKKVIKERVQHIYSKTNQNQPSRYRDWFAVIWVLPNSTAATWHWIMSVMNSHTRGILPNRQIKNTANREYLLAVF